MSEHRLDAREIAARLADRAEALCAELLPGGRKIGPEWRCGSVAGEASNGKHGGSLAVALKGAKRGIWADFTTDERGDLLDLIKAARRLSTVEAMAWAADWLGTAVRADGDENRRESPPARYPSASENGEKARAIWRASKPITGTLAANYLRHRGINSSQTADGLPALRHHGALPHPDLGQHLPALVAAVSGPDRKVTAIQRTWLRLDGQGKAQCRRPKMAFGPLRDGAVRLAPAGPVLGLAEGVEDALSAAQLFDVPCWAALGCGRFASVAIPAEVVELHIFADNGAPGHEAAEKAAAVLREQGRRTVLRFPPAGLGDFNDMLRNEVAA